MTDNYYYNIETDLEAYPNAWCVVVIGGRNTGKTYGTLNHSLKKHKMFTFLKRTIEDVDLLCSGSGRIGSKQSSYGVDLSPFKAINRDEHTNVKAFSIWSGLGGFWHANDEGAEGLPIGYLVSLSAVSKVKGFDLSDSEYLIFDEFIPQPWERVNRKEGEQLMDLYKTISRDKEHRGLPPLKLICLANAVAISNPTTNILEITDDIAQMQAVGESVRYLEDRGILIHILNDNDEFREKEHSTLLYNAMGQTAWGQMAFDNQFAYNDFSNVSHVRLKNYQPVTSFTYKRTDYFVYQKDGQYYITRSRHTGGLKHYDLNKENDQKAFYYDYAIDLRNECINGRVKFEQYTLYDIIVNYKKYFQI